MTELSENIIKLRKAGFTYPEIAETLKCSKGTVSYHCSPGQKEKTRERTRKRRSSNSFFRKIENFQKPTQVRTEKTLILSTISKVKKNKIGTFQTNVDGSVTRVFRYSDVIDKFGAEAVCYLTGDTLDLNNPSSFHFDHIQPRSKGGSNTLDNLGLVTKEANAAKSNSTQEEFIELCLKVVRYNGYTVV